MVLDKILVYVLGAATVVLGISLVVTKMQLSSTETDLANAKTNLTVLRGNVSTLEETIKDANAKTEQLKKDSDAANEAARKLLAQVRTENKALEQRIKDLKGQVRPQGVDACTFANTLIDSEIDRRKP